MVFNGCPKDGPQEPVRVVSYSLVLLTDFVFNSRMGRSGLSRWFAPLCGAGAGAGAGVVFIARGLGVY